MKSRRKRCPRCSPKSWARCCRCAAATPVRWCMRHATRGSPPRSSAQPTAGDRVRVVRHGRAAHRRGAHRPASRVVVDHACVAGAARPSGVGRAGIRAHSRRGRSGDLAAPDVQPGRRRCRAVHRHRRASPRRDPARAGRQRPGRDGGRVRSRRFRRVRRAHERPRGRTALARRIQGLRGGRRLFLWRRPRRGRGLGQVDPLQREAARRLCRILCAAGHFRARRVQRLPDDGQSARPDSGRRALAAFHSQQVRAVRRRAWCWSK